MPSERSCIILRIFDNTALDLRSHPGLHPIG